MGPKMYVVVAVSSIFLAVMQCSLSCFSFSFFVFFVFVCGVAVFRA